MSWMNTYMGGLLSGINQGHQQREMDRRRQSQTFEELEFRNQLAKQQQDEAFRRQQAELERQVSPETQYLMEQRLGLTYGLSPDEQAELQRSQVQQQELRAPTAPEFVGPLRPGEENPDAAAARGREQAAQEIDRRIQFLQQEKERRPSQRRQFTQRDVEQFKGAGLFDMPKRSLADEIALAQEKAKARGEQQRETEEIKGEQARKTRSEFDLTAEQKLDVANRRIEAYYSAVAAGLEKARNAQSSKEQEAALKSVESYRDRIESELRAVNTSLNSLARTPETRVQRLALEAQKANLQALLVEVRKVRQQKITQPPPAPARPQATPGTQARGKASAPAKGTVRMRKGSEVYDVPEAQVSAAEKDGFKRQ